MAAAVLALVPFAAGVIVGLLAGPRGSTIVAILLLGGSLALSFRFVLPELETNVTHTRSNEARVLRELTSLAEAQKLYAALSAGFFEANLECLTRTQLCLPELPEAGPLWSGAPPGLEGIGSGYLTAFVPHGWVGTRGGSSPTQIRAFTLLALPTNGERGRFGFCVDLDGVRFSTRGNVPATIDGRCAR